MDDEELLRIADEQLNFLDRMSVLHQRRMQTAIEALEKRIVDKLTILKTSDSGNLLGVKTNLAQAQKVHSDLTTLFDEEYGSASRTTVKEYSESLPIIQEQYKAMEEAVKYTGVDKEMVKALKTQDLAAYSQFGVATQDKIATALYDHVVAQSPFSTLAAAIAGALTGHKDARGKPLSNYAKQMANDGIMNFHNAVNLKKAEDAGFTHFLYVGNVIADSRDFCVKRAGNVYTKEQINSWTGPWQGKSGPAMTHRGGYNCRHHWQPVRKEWIPEGGIEVQSWFDRAGTSSVANLSPIITDNPKFRAYQIWQRSILIDKKPLTAAEVAQLSNVKKASASAWISRWNKGFDMPKGWQSVVKDLEAELGGVVPPPPTPEQVVKAVAAAVTEVKPVPITPTVVQEVQVAAKEAVKDITQDALTTAREKLDGSLDRFMAQRKEIYDLVGGMRPSDPVLVNDGIHRMSLKAGKYHDPLDSLTHRAMLEGKDSAAIKDLLKPMITQHEVLLDEIGEHILTILDLDDSLAPLSFKQATDATAAKAFYANVTNRKNAVESLLKKYGFKNSPDKSSYNHSLSPIEHAFKTGFSPLPADASVVQIAQQKVAAKIFEHLRLEKQARYQWLKLVDDKTYQAQRRKVTDSLVRIKPGKNDYWKSAEGKKLIKAEKQLKTAMALDHVPIDLLESMQENGYKINFSSKSGRSFCEGFTGDSTIFETYKKKMGGGTTAWDVISHEFGHQIDHFFDQNFRNTGGKWGGVKAELYVTDIDGDNYRGWFSKQHKGIVSQYSNGDGDYFDDNWMNSYEGRIYGKGDGRVGEEWWAMNNQRFAYQNVIDKLGVADASRMLGPPSGHLGISSWKRAKDLYPELTRFIEQLFDKKNRTALY